MTPLPPDPRISLVWSGAMLNFEPKEGGSDRVNYVLQEDLRADLAQVLTWS